MDNLRPFEIFMEHSYTIPKLDTLQSILQDPPLLLSQLRRFVTQCCTLLEEGGQPELKGLDDHVRILCDHINAMPSNEADKFRPKLESLVAELNGLSQLLDAQKGDIVEQLANLSRQRQAHAAYERVNTSVPPLPKGEEDFRSLGE
jgi:hypothetical protein